MRPHILFITERYPPDLGGVATSSGRISRVLAQWADVDVVAWTRSLEPGRVAQVDGNPAVYRMGRYRDWDSTMPHTMNLVDWLASMRPYDAIWGHYLAPAGFVAVFLGRLQGVPATVSIRGNDLDRDMFPPGDFSRLMWTLERATVISAVTLELARKVGALCGRTDVVHLPNSVDADVFRPKTPSLALREELGILPEEVVLGFAGELREKKGQTHLIQALRRVRETRPACLLVIGEVRASQLLEYLPSEERVIVTGHLTSPAAVNERLQLCDVFLQPSLWDGMPNALLEAMAAGLGCIASDAGGIPEIVVPGESGVIVPRWQLHRLGDVVIEWLDGDSQHRLGIREAARARVMAEFSQERERPRLEALLHRLLSEPLQTVPT